MQTTSISLQGRDISATVVIQIIALHLKYPWAVERKLCRASEALQVYKKMGK